jgi:hypothetical protein
MTLDSKDIDLVTWNRAALALTESLICKVSPQLRCVNLSKIDDGWEVEIIFETENGQNYEDATDITDRFIELIGDDVNVKEIIAFSQENIAWPLLEKRTIFRRKEFS